MNFWNKDYVFLGINIHRHFKNVLIKVDVVETPELKAGSAHFQIHLRGILTLETRRNPGKVSSFTVSCEFVTGATQKMCPQ